MKILVWDADGELANKWKVATWYKDLELLNGSWCLTAIE